MYHFQHDLCALVCRACACASARRLAAYAPTLPLSMLVYVIARAYVLACQFVCVSVCLHAARRVFLVLGESLSCAALCVCRSGFVRVLLRAVLRVCPYVGSVFAVWFPDSSHSGDAVTSTEFAQHVKACCSFVPLAAAGGETNAPWSHRNPRPYTPSASLGTCLAAFPATLGTSGASGARGAEGSSAPALRTERRSASMRSPWLAALPRLCGTEHRSMQKAHARNAGLSTPPCWPPTKMDSQS
jgi:hypothetical protein